MLLKTPLARITKGSLNCKYKGWEREEGMRPVRGDYKSPLPATPVGTAVLGVQGDGSKSPASEKGNG